MVSRRSFLQAFAAFAGSPMMPRIPFAAEVMAAGEVFQNVAGPNSPYIETLKEMMAGFFQSRQHAKMTHNKFMYGRHKSESSADFANRWYLNHLLDAGSKLLYFSQCKDWDSYVDGSSCKEAGAQDAHEIFSNQETLLSALNNEIEKVLEIIHGGNVPQRDNISKDAFSLSYSNNNMHLYDIVPGELKALSRNDINFLIEGRFMSEWGFKPGVLNLSQEHDEMLSILEKHPLSRFVQSVMRGPTHGYCGVSYKRGDFIDIFNRDDIAPKITHEEANFLSQFQKQLSDATSDWTGDNGLPKVGSANFSFKDIEQTVDSPDAFIRKAREKYDHLERVRKDRDRRDALNSTRFEKLFPAEVGSGETVSNFGDYSEIYRAHSVGDFQDAMIEDLRERFSEAVVVRVMGDEVFVMPTFMASDQDMSYIDSKTWNKYDSRDQGLIMCSDQPSF